MDKIDRSRLKFVVLIVIVLVCMLYPSLSKDPPKKAVSSPNAHKNLSTEQQRPSAAVTGDQQILTAYQEQTSNLIVSSHGFVVRILPDDLEGSRHQRFILRLSNQLTILVSHNIDLAPRIEGIKKGDRIEFFGEYEWNDRGGVVHWTHHDPDGSHPGGWLKHNGQIYD